MSPTALLASPVDQRIYKTLLGLDNIDVFDRWIQTHQLVPIAKPDLVYLQVRIEFDSKTTNHLSHRHLAYIQPAFTWIQTNGLYRTLMAHH